MKPAALILCGGQSRRMGRSKAWLPFGPERMLARVVRRVAEAAEPIVVVAAPDQAIPPLPVPAIVARDPVRGRGPLQGLAVGLSALPESVELVYATATDVPFISSSWIGRLAVLIGDHDLAVPHIDGFHHPLAALYRRGPVLAEVGSLLAADRLRPVFLMEALATRIVSADEMREADPTLATLRNLNTFDEYRQALAEAGHGATPRVTFELFGVPRLKAGVREVIVEAWTLAEALAGLAERCPPLTVPVIDGGTLSSAYRLSLNSEQFVTDPSLPLVDGDALILLSADVGG